MGARKGSGGWFSKMPNDTDRGIFKEISSKNRDKVHLEPSRAPSGFSHRARELPSWLVTARLGTATNHASAQHFPECTRLPPERMSECGSWNENDSHRLICMSAWRNCLGED